MKKLSLLVLLCLPSVAYSQGVEASRIRKTSFVNLGTPSDSNVRDCWDCSITAGTGVCASGGTGATATRRNGTWYCSTGGTAGTAGMVTSVSVTTANGISGSVANPTTTPAITLTLGAITPSSIVTAGSITAGSFIGSGSGAGYLELTQGTAPSLGTTSIQIVAPASVTSYQFKLPAASATGVMLGTNSSNVNTVSFIAPGTSGNILTSNGSTWTSAAAAGGGITVGTTTITSGTDTRVPFNDAGVYGEDAGMVFSKASDTLTLAGSVVATQGSSAAASFQFNGLGGGTGMFYSGGGGVGFNENGNWLLSLVNNHLILRDTGSLLFQNAAANPAYGTPDVGIVRSGTNTLGVSDGTGANANGKLTLLAQTVSSATAPITFSNAAYQSCVALTTNGSGVLGCTVSTAKAKQGFRLFRGGLDVIRRIQPQTFSYRPESFYADGGKTHLGLVAENLKAANPLLASETRAGMLQPEPMALAATMIDAIKTLDARITSLEKENRRLRRLMRGHRK